MDGTVHRNGKTRGLAVGKCKQRLSERSSVYVARVRRFVPKVTKMVSAGMRELPLNDGSGQNRSVHVSRCLSMFIVREIREINKLQKR